MLLSYMQRRLSCLVLVHVLAHGPRKTGNGARPGLCIGARHTGLGACLALGFFLVALGLVRYDVLALHWRCRDPAAIDRTR